MKLYGSIASPYVARVAMFADLKGMQIEMEAAPGGMGSDEYKAIVPIRNEGADMTIIALED